LEPSMSRQWPEDQVERAAEYINFNKPHIKPYQLDFLRSKFAGYEELLTALNNPSIHYSRELQRINRGGQLTSDIYQYLMRDTFPEATEPPPPSESDWSNWMEGQGFKLATDQTMTTPFQPDEDGAEDIDATDQIMTTSFQPGDDNAEYGAEDIDGWNPNMATPRRKKP